MAQATTAPRPTGMEPLPADIERWRFTVDEFHRMGEIGILDEDDRVELIDGEIIVMSPIGLRHRQIVNNLTRLLVLQAADRYTVSVQNSFVLSEYGEPLPDIVLDRQDAPRDRIPTPADIYLVVEVSDSTLAYDLNVKLPRYARAAVPEYWVVDVAGERVERFSEPRSDGTYATQARFGHDDEIESIMLPTLTLSVRDILA